MAGRRGKSRKHQQTTPPAPVQPAPPVPPPPSSVPPENVLRQSEFDRLEDRIRGEDILAAQEGKKAKEQLEIKKKLTDKEIDRRLEELKKKVGL